MEEQLAPPPHVVIFPFPAQGHMNSMLKLAELLCLAGMDITFIVTTHNHNRLHLHTSIQARFSRYPSFRFSLIPDSLPDGLAHSPNGLMDLHDSLKHTAKPILRELLTSSGRRTDSRGDVTCVIADGILSLAIDVAEEVGIPIIYFRTVSACAFWAYFSIPKLIEADELPFPDEDMDVMLTDVKGMEGFLRRRDLPSFCRAHELNTPGFHMVMNETQQTTRAKALIMNTFEDLEGSMLDQIRTQVPNIYSIGPLHMHLKSRLAMASISQPDVSNSLWKEDRSCIEWLDKQPKKSVIYVSFGSFTTITKDAQMEFWHGLVNSKKRFLWVVRPDSVKGKDEDIPIEVSEGTKERGYIVDWAPQEDVLRHPAVGGFLTHSGWNSTLESIVAGVPMICWPYFADQQINSRFVGEIWRLGLDMKDSCDRATIEKMVRDLMEVRRDEFLLRAKNMAKLAEESTSQGGTSYCNLDRLIKDIYSMAK